MASKLSQLAQQRTAAQLQTMGRESIKWLTKKISDLRNPTGIASVIAKEQFRKRNRFQVGGMYYFYYDPKTKDDLPYYDRFPLVIPIENYKDGFLGLNLHYIHPRQRIILLDKLSETSSNKTFDERTKLKILTNSDFVTESYFF